MLVELQRKLCQLRKLVPFELGFNLMYPVNFFRFICEQNQRVASNRLIWPNKDGLISAL
jgi:hypothetical protein